MPRLSAVALILVLAPAALRADPILVDYGLSFGTGSSISDLTGVGPLVASGITIASQTNPYTGLVEPLSGYAVNFRTGAYVTGRDPSVRRYGGGGEMTVTHDGVLVFDAYLDGDATVTTLPGGSVRVLAGTAKAYSLTPCGAMPAGYAFDFTASSVFTATTLGNGGFVSTSFGSGEARAYRSNAVPEPGPLALAALAGAVGLAWKSIRG